MLGGCFIALKSSRNTAWVVSTSYTVAMQGRPKKWKTMHSKHLFTHPRLSVVEDTIKLPNGATTTYVRHAPAEHHSVCIIAVNAKGEILLQQEYSHPPAKIMWQLPGGSMYAGEEILKAANRELAEESGYMGKSLKSLGYYYVHNRLSDKKQYVVMATDLYKKSLQADDDEFISSHWLSESAVIKKIKQGTFDNINLLAALNIWFHREH